MRRSSTNFVWLGLAVIATMAHLSKPACAAGAGSASRQPPAANMVLIPAGSFEMGDHHGFVDPKHGGDETPIHSVRLDAFFMGIHDVTTKEYCEFLNSALGQSLIEVKQGGVFLKGGRDLLVETREMSRYSRIGWDGRAFSVLDKKENHPVVCIRWAGAAVYCNWMSAQKKLPTCYNIVTWECDLNKSGFRLPTEAEWEYAARGGQSKPYWNFPFANEADATKANWPESKNPFRAGPQPWTTPVGFFNGKVQWKADFDWPGAAETFATGNGANAFGLYDMSGNVWQLINDWYERGYYAYSPSENPPGPASGSIMPDGKAYRGMRGGNWYNGENGHGRVSNRNPSYYRGPQDPEHPYYHLGFRVVVPVDAESRPVVKPTPVQRVARADGQGGRRPGEGGGQDRRGGGGGGQGERRRPDDQGGAADNRPARPEERGVTAVEDNSAMLKPVSGFTLTSSEVTDGGALPKEFTGDGASATLPLQWTNPPAGTKSLAVIMHHIPGPGDSKWYWIVYNIPADAKSLAKNVKGIGTLGNNSVNGRTEYAPPHSKGPGAKLYTYTVYALSAAPQIDGPAQRVSRDVLLAAMKDRILGTAQLKVTYTRAGTEMAANTGGGNRPDNRDNPGGDNRPPRDGQSGDNRPPRDDNADNRPPRNDDGGDRRPPRNDDQNRQAGGQGNRQGGGRDDNRGGGGGQERRGGGGGGAVGPRENMPENKTPVSPNPGQTVGLFLSTSKASPGYLLMSPKHNTVTYLLDLQGRIVNQWKSKYEPGQSAHLLPNGHLLRSGMLKVQGGTAGGEGGRIEEYDWNGKLVWEFDHATRDYTLHHDIKPLPNGNVLALMVERKTLEQAVAAGFDARMLRDQYLVPDAVVEIQPIYPKGGKIVWEWHVWDHLIQDFDKTKANYGDVAAHPELVNVHCNGRASPAFWNHMNSLAYNPKLDQIVLSVRGCNEIWVIDHSTSTKEAASHSGGKSGKGGDLLYRWGNPAAYGRGTTRDKQLVQQHDAQWIPDGYPGAGHLTIFNNGYDRGWSSIEEIAAPMDLAGRYILNTGKAYGPDKPAWHYEAKNRTDFFSAEISGAHRLKNGNMLVCAGTVGHLFEVTPEGEMVWQYVNPMVRGGILAQGELPGKDVRGHLYNAVFKVHRYEPDYPGLAGKDLSPKGVIELPASEKGKTGFDRADAGPNDRPGGGGGNRPGGGGANRPGGRDGGGGGGGGGRDGNRPDDRTVPRDNPRDDTRPPRPDDRGGDNRQPRDDQNDNRPPRDNQGGGDNRPPRPDDRGGNDHRGGGQGGNEARGNDNRGGQGGGQPGGQGGGGQGGVRLLRREAAEQMNLTPDQQTQIDELEKLINTKLQQILTPEQQKILQDSRPPRRDQGGPPRPGDR